MIASRRPGVGNGIIDAGVRFLTGAIDAVDFGGSVSGASKVMAAVGAAVKVSAHTVFCDAGVFDRKKNGVPAEMVDEDPGAAAAEKRLRVDISPSSAQSVFSGSVPCPQ